MDVEQKVMQPGQSVLGTSIFNNSDSKSYDYQRITVQNFVNIQGQRFLRLLFTKSTPANFRNASVDLSHLVSSNTPLAVEFRDGTRTMKVWDLKTGKMLYETKLSDILHGDAPLFDDGKFTSSSGLVLVRVQTAEGHQSTIRQLSVHTSR